MNTLLLRPVIAALLDDNGLPLAGARAHLRISRLPRPTAR